MLSSQPQTRPCVRAQLSRWPWDTHLSIIPFIAGLCPLNPWHTIVLRCVIQTVNPCCHSPLLPSHRTSPSVQKAEFGMAKEAPVTPWRHMWMHTWERWWKQGSVICSVFQMFRLPAKWVLGTRLFRGRRGGCVENVTSCQSKELQLFLTVEPQEMFLHPKHCNVPAVHGGFWSALFTDDHNGPIWDCRWHNRTETKPVWPNFNPRLIWFEFLPEDPLSSGWTLGPFSSFFKL